MKIKFLSITAAALLISSLAIAQGNEARYERSTWNPSPSLHSMPAAFKGQSAVYLLDSRVYHYKFEGKDLFQYNQVHKIVKVEDDNGIEMFNTIHIPVSSFAEVSEIKARVITSSGKVINVPPGKIKEEEEDGTRYKLFALEGIDKGSEVEYTYTVKRAPNFFGSEIFQTKAVPFHKAKLLIITPKHIKFEGRGFNGFSILKDSLINDERIIAGYSENIPELDDEKYGLRDPQLQRADFKFSYNLSQNKDVELYTWKELAGKVYNNATLTSEKEKKAVNKFLAATAIESGAGEETSIKKLEDYLKNKINIDDKLVSEDATDIEAIIKTGNSNNFGALRLFVAMLEAHSIKYQLVFPSVRSQLPLEEDLANWNRIEEMLVYFPGIGKYVDPAASAVRYPFFDPYWAGTRGFFVKGTVIGDVRTATGKFDNIAIEPVEQSYSNMIVHAKLNAVADSVILNSKQILGGYSAMNYRPLWAYLPKDKLDEAVKDIVQGIAKSENITNIKCENTLLTDSWSNKPLIIGATIHTAELIEKAGNKLLLKLGEFIGTQTEMYQEKARKLPVDVGYPHLLERKITFEIPEGYVIKNPESIVNTVENKKDGKVNMGFVSSYKLDKNILTVDVLETYADLTYPLSDFEVFKKVINAAADFNKVVLVLEKKN